MGFTPGVSTVHDATVLATGYNVVTGERVGLGGRSIALVGMVTPLSGGTIRVAGDAIEGILAKGLKYHDRVEKAFDIVHNFPRLLDAEIVGHGRWAQRIKDRAHWFEMDGTLHGRGRHVPVGYQTRDKRNLSSCVGEMVKRLRVWADTYSSGLLDEEGSSLRRHEAPISDRTWNELQRWVEDYDYIIPLGRAEREARAREIEALDQRGLDLLAAIRAEWVSAAPDEPVAFAYYSEGLMRSLPCGE